MNLYPYQSPIILNDAIFLQYGGQSGTFSAAQRSAAYLIAEKQATVHIGSFLLPTVVTGTFGYAPRLRTDYGYVSQVYSVNILGRVGSSDIATRCDIRSDTGCVFVWEDTFGYLDVGCVMSYCGCSSVAPYQVQAAYQAGLPTGVASQPDILLALTMAATISLNEMTFPSQNEGAGDIGIEAFSSLDYSEKRKSLKNTAFGNSARANKAAQLISSAVRLARPALRLR